MKRTRRMLSFVLALVMCLAMGITAFAASDPSITIKTTSTDEEAQKDTTEYTWYRIFEADIEEDPSQSGAMQSDGKVTYYVTTQARANEIAGTDLFNVTQVGTTDKWYVELKDKEHTSAATIAAKFAEMNLEVFESDTFEQSSVAGEAYSGPLAPGYYYITSTAGTNVVIQTLTAVEIEEKNTFPTIKKDIDSTDKNAQIGDEIEFTLTVSVPNTANDQIVLTDVMSAGLTFKAIDHVKVGETDVDGYVLDPDTAAAITEADNTFTITFDADTVAANKGKKIEIKYTAILNNKAVVGAPDTNKVTLKYGDNYESKPKEVETQTYSFAFDKVDGKNSATKLTGAKFEFKRDNVVLPLVEIEEGKIYRIATEEDTVTVTEITTNGNTVTINGLDTDAAYALHETKAPTGYNVLESDVEVKTNAQGTFDHKDIGNFKGSVLPSTGGIGTTLFYVVGSILVIGAVVLLISKRRMNDR